MQLNHRLRMTQLYAGQADVLCQFYRRRKPEFRFTLWVCNVDVNACLLAGEQEQSELTIADNCGCHARDCSPDSYLR